MWKNCKTELGKNVKFMVVNGDMTNKRFKLHTGRGDEWYILNTETNARYISLGKVVGLLNHLHQENQQLKHYKLYEDNKRLQTIIADLKEENEQLKSYIDSMFLGNTHICKELDIEDAMFYCEKKEKHIYPNCLYHKCFDEENIVEVKEEIRKCTDD